jgi:hypothetical protein
MSLWQIPKQTVELLRDFWEAALVSNCEDHQQGAQWTERWEVEKNKKWFFLLLWLLWAIEAPYENRGVQQIVLLSLLSINDKQPKMIVFFWLKKR